MNTSNVGARRELLAPELRDFILKWKDKPGNLIMVLHQVQEHYGYISRDVAIEVADLLQVPLAKIYGIVTFYHLFKLRKPGKNKVAVCLGTACYLKGGEDLVRELENLLGISVNSVTPDGDFSLEVVRCIGCCGLGPTMMVNGEVYGELKVDDVAGILAKYRGK